MQGGGERGTEGERETKEEARDREEETKREKGGNKKRERSKRRKPAHTCNIFACFSAASRHLSTHRRVSIAVNVFERFNLDIN